MIKRDRSKVTHDDGIDYCDLCNYCIDGLDICSNTCAFVVVRHQALQKREALVQEVIASWNEYITAYRESPNAYRANSLRVAVLRRVEALAEWKP